MNRLLTVCLLLAGAAHAAPEAPRAGHPILGIWELRVPGSTCTETYRFRGDGTALVTSHLEVSESEYHVRAQPDELGFYAWDDRVVKDNGKTDCTGEVIKVGDATRKYLRFAPAGNMFLMCFEASMTQCIGPFRRVVGAGT
jgi:hypothetical protein